MVNVSNTESRYSRNVNGRFGRPKTKKTACPDFCRSKEGKRQSRGQAEGTSCSIQKPEGGTRTGLQKQEVYFIWAFLFRLGLFPHTESATITRSSTGRRLCKPGSGRVRRRALRGHQKGDNCRQAHPSPDRRRNRHRSSRTGRTFAGGASTGRGPIDCGDKSFFSWQLV